MLEGSRLFNWSVLVTPVRPLNLTQQFKERWAQLSGPANCTCSSSLLAFSKSDRSCRNAQTRSWHLMACMRDQCRTISPHSHLTQTVAVNRTVVNIHQGNTLNPWINYPYLTSAALRAAADECRQLGVRYS